MKILDTDILISFLRKDKDAITKLTDLEGTDTAITVFSWQELLFGPAAIENTEEYKIALELLTSYKFLNYETEDTLYTVKILTHLKKNWTISGFSGCNDSCYISAA